MPTPQAHVKEFPESQTSIAEAIELFLIHVAAHSPDKPGTVRRYRQVLEPFERRLVISGSSRPSPARWRPPRINFEVATLRTFFYYFINEREVEMKNPWARFKKLRDASQKAEPKRSRRRGDLPT